MIKRKLKVTLSISGPMLTRAAVVGPLGVDTPGARRKNPEDGGMVLYLPQTLVEGKIREAFVQLADIAPDRFTDDERDTLFGRSTGGGNEDLRGALGVSDFYMRPEDFGRLVSGNGRRHRIAIDARRKSVQRGSLEVMDCPVPPGMTVQFSGALVFFGRDDAELNRRQAALHSSLCWVAQIGANRSSGFGRLENVLFEEDVDFPPADLNPGEIPEMLTEQTERLGIVLTFQGNNPFCVTGRVNRNYFESGEILSGAVAKGAIAATLNQARGCHVRKCIDGSLADYPALGTHFESVRLTHLFPSVSNGQLFQRPIFPPLSLVKTKTGTDFSDVALIDESGLVEAAGDGNKRHWSPEFDIDWKGREDVETAFGWPPPLSRELRVHNQHDPDRRRAMDERLYAHLLAIPEEGRCWVGWVGLEKVPQDHRKQVATDLFKMFSSLEFQIGKTKSPARVRLVMESQICVPENRSTNPEGVDVDGRTCWVLTLQSQAILCDPDELAKKELLTVCGEQFRRFGLSPDIQLLRVFARQSLVGDYIANRYQGPGKPFLLFEPGSTFVFTLGRQDAEIRKQANGLFSNWQQHGLPFPDWAEKAYARNEKSGGHWSNCPYISGNGYGAVAVNIDTHVSKKATMKGPK